MVGGILATFAVIGCWISLSPADRPRIVPRSIERVVVPTGFVAGVYSEGYRISLLLWIARNLYWIEFSLLDLVGVAIMISCEIPAELVASAVRARHGLTRSPQSPAPPGRSGDRLTVKHENLSPRAANMHFWNKLSTAALMRLTILASLNLLMGRLVARLDILLHPWLFLSIITLNPGALRDHGVFGNLEHDIDRNDARWTRGDAGDPGVRRHGRVVVRKPEPAFRRLRHILAASGINPALEALPEPITCTGRSIRIAGPRFLATCFSMDWA